MNYRPARRLADIEPFHVVELLTRARQLESEGRDIIHMEVGEPDFPTPEPIARAAVAAIQGGKTLYTQALGLPELRQAICDYLARRRGIQASPDDVLVVAGKGHEQHQIIGSTVHHFDDVAEVAAALEAAHV